MNLREYTLKYINIIYRYNTVEDRSMKMLNPLLKKLKRIAFIILFLGMGAGAFTIGYKLTSFSKPAETAVLNPEDSNERNAFDLKESILEEAKEKRELIV